MIDILYNIVWILFWTWFGFKLFNYFHKKTEAIPANIVIKHIPMLKTETHHGIIYVFNASDDNFVSQGSTLDEIADSIHKFKKIDLALVTHEDSQYWFINGKPTPVKASIL